MNIRIDYVDKKPRCYWTNPKNKTYIRYHDEEWGVAVYDDHKLFEMLILESFQAGLSWECVLNKREAFTQAFDHFEIDKVCRYDEAKIEELLANEGIIRNKRKMNAAVTNAIVYKKIQEEFGSFSEYIWGFTNKEVIYENDKVSSPLSDRISKDLKKRGMKFVGTTIIYSYLQAIGIIYSHLDGCYLCKSGQKNEK